MPMQLANTENVTFSQTVRATIVGTGYSITLEPHIVQAICDLAEHNRVKAIRFVRSHFDLGLKEAKDLVDALYPMPDTGERG